MAIRYASDLYPRTDPLNGTRIIRFSQLQSAEYRGEANGTGSGKISLRADTTDAGNIDPRGLQYIRVVRINDSVVDAGTLSGFDELVIGGFFLDSGDFELLDERGTRLLTFGGAGTLSYLSRAVMAPHSYLDEVLVPGNDPFDDMWRLYAQGPLAGGEFLGAMLWRVIVEAQNFRSGASYTHIHPDGSSHTGTHADDRTASALGALTLGFDQFDDSDGTAWDATSGEFKAQVGENVLQVVKRLMEAGLYVSMDPDTFELNAWQAENHRRDRTGSAWGANVVRFQAPTDGTVATGNIKSDAKRGIRAFIKRSLLWVGGQDIYSKVTSGSAIPWEGHYYSDTANTTALTQIGNTQIGARDEAGDTIRLRGKLGNSEANGRYKPFEHARLDDLVTVHSGTGQFDYDEQDFPIAAIALNLRPGSDWDVWYDLGSAYTSNPERRFQVAPVPAHNHPPNPRLCRDGVPASPVGGNVEEAITWDHQSGNALDTTGTYACMANYSPTSSGAISGPHGTNATTYSLTSRRPVSPGQIVHIEGIVSARAMSLVTKTNLIFWYDTIGDVNAVSSETISVSTLSNSSTQGTFSGDVVVPDGVAEFQIRMDRQQRCDNILLQIITPVTGSGGTSGVGCDIQPTVLPGQSTHGTCGGAAPCDHQHEHGVFGPDGLLHGVDQVEQMVTVAAADPTVDDDGANGFRVGWHWVNSSSGEVFVLADATGGAAVWQEIGGSSSTSGAGVPHSHPDYDEAAFAITSAPIGGWNRNPSPKALHYNGWTYWAWVKGTNGDVGVSALEDGADPSTVVNRTVHAAALADDHAVPVICIRESDHKLLVLHTGHSDSYVHFAVSTTSLDTDPDLSDGFGSEANLDSQLGGTDYTHPTLWQLTGMTGSPLFLTVRDVSGGTYRYRYSTSTDGGTTWSALTTFYGNSNLGVHISVSRTTPTRVDFLATTSNPSNSDSSLVHFYYDDGDWFTTDGTNVTASLPLDASEATQVWDGSVEGAWNDDVALGIDGNPVAVFTVLYSTTDHRYMWARWTGTAWEVYEVIEGGGYMGDGTEPSHSGGMSLDQRDPTTLYAAIEKGSTFEVSRLTTPDGGPTWVEDPITTGSVSDNLRPVAVRDPDPSLRVLWMVGTWDLWNDYSVGISGAGVTSAAGTHDHDADYEPLGAIATHAADPDAHHSASAGGSAFVVDSGTPTYDDTTDPDVVEVSVISQWGIDSAGDPYFNSAGVTSGEEAALMRDPDTGEYLLRSYNF